jgi:hypothetical protein
MASVDNIVLPARCSCGDGVVYASLGELASGPIDVPCPSCGIVQRLDVGPHAQRLRETLADRLAGHETEAVSVVIGGNTA